MAVYSSVEEIPEWLRVWLREADPDFDYSDTGGFISQLGGRLYVCESIPGLLPPPEAIEVTPCDNYDVHLYVLHDGGGPTYFTKRKSA